MKMTAFLMLALLGVVASQGYEPEPPTLVYTLNGIVTLDGHRCVFRNGELTMTGALLSPGEQGDFNVETGFATSESGQLLRIDGGRLTVVSLASTDTQAISNALARSGVTVDQFFQQTGTIPPENGVFEVISGIAIVNGVYYEVDVGVVVVLSAVEAEPTGPGGFQPSLNPGIQQTRSVVVTEAYRTTTVTEPVTLTKYSTSDVFVTVVAPVYNSYDATATNFIKQTVNVPENQVIRSQAAGNIVVNTVTVTSQTVVVVRDTSTQFSVLTAIGDALARLEQISTNFIFSTVTIDVPVTSSIVQTITRTSVTTAYITSTVGQTLISTSTVYITQAPATQVPRGY